MPMSKKNYEKAARIVQAFRESEIGEPPVYLAGKTFYPSEAIEESFIMLFQDDNPRYDVALFRRACRRK